MLGLAASVPGLSAVVTDEVEEGKSSCELVVHSTSESPSESTLPVT